MREPTRPELNAVGDVVLTEPAALHALADPFRLALHDELRRHGPSTSEQLAPLLREQPSVIREHLEQLELAGLVERRDETTWEVVGKGVFFEIPAEPEGQAAARALSRAMFRHYADLPSTWTNDLEPRLDLEWARAAGLLNARLFITPDELRHIQDGIEQLIEPLLTRQDDEVPEDAAHVRLLSYFMPEGPARP